MKLQNLTLLAILSFSLPSLALLNKVQKYEVVADRSIFDGYEQDGTVYLYAPVGQQKLQPAEVIASVASREGIETKDYVLIHTKISGPAACVVDAIFENNDLSVFCDETQNLKNLKSYGPATTEQSSRNFYLIKISEVEKDLNSLNAFSKNQVAELKSSTTKFLAGEKVRVTHIFKGGYVVIEHEYPRLSPQYQDLVSIDNLK